MVKVGKKAPSGFEKFKNVTKMTFEGIKPWGLTPVQRGKMLDLLLGNNLGVTFKTYDKYVDGVATSFKSIDPRSASYLEPSKFNSLLEKYARDLVKGDTSFSIGEKLYEVDQKVLKLIVPDVPLSEGQTKILENFIKKYEKVFKVEITIVP